MIYVSANSFRCHEETDDGLSAADEPYLVVVAVDLRATVAVGGFDAPIPSSRAYRYGPFSNVDGAENHLISFQSFWGLNGEEKALTDPNDAIFVAALMESDDGNAEAMRQLVAQAANSAMFATLSDDRQIKVNNLIQGVNAVLALPTAVGLDQDDQVGGPQELRFSREDIAFAETGQSAIQSLRFTGDGGDYTMIFHAQNRGQTAWRFCFRCRSMYFDGYPTKGQCPASGGHAAAGYMFFLPHDHAGPWGGQPDWRFCDKCFSMFWAGDPANQGRCITGGGHSFYPQSFNFFLPHDHAGPGQDQWRFCNRCRAMFWNGEDNKGLCPEGGGHNAQGVNFKLDFTP